MVRADGRVGAGLVPARLGGRPQGSPLRISLLCLVLSFVAVPKPLLGQQPPARFSVASNLILVDVRVLDSRGRPVEGLSVEDFVLLEEGMVQQITFFQEISLPLVSVEPSVVPTRGDSVSMPVKSVEPLASDDPSEMAPIEKRFLILLFDFSSAGLQDSHMMKRAAQSFLTDQFTSDDAAAVLVLDNGLEMLTDFTSDRELLAEAIAHLLGEETETDPPFLERKPIRAGTSLPMRLSSVSFSPASSWRQFKLLPMLSAMFRAGRLFFTFRLVFRVAEWRTTTR